MKLLLFLLENHEDRIPILSKVPWEYHFDNFSPEEVHFFRYLITKHFFSEKTRIIDNIINAILKIFPQWVKVGLSIHKNPFNHVLELIRFKT